MTNRYLILGAGGFIGGHMARILRIRSPNCVIHGSDIRGCADYEQRACNQYHYANLYNLQNVCEVISEVDPDVIINFAADMGGMGYITTHKFDCMMSASINLNVLKALRTLQIKPKYFFASSACVYPDKEGELREEDVWPAMPEPGYGLEKLFSEQICLAAQDWLPVRIARLHNVYGPYGTWTGGREKAPAAICRKIAKAKLCEEKEIEIWGTGRQSRTFLYVTDCCHAILDLIHSTKTGPYNIGSDEGITIATLSELIMSIANYFPSIKYVDGPVGVQHRSSDNTAFDRAIGLRERTPLFSGLQILYPWIENEVRSRLAKNEQGRID